MSVEGGAIKSYVRARIVVVVESRSYAEGGFEQVFIVLVAAANAKFHTT